jgi:hypothetical protein
LISVHLLDSLLTVGGNLTRDHRYRSSNASSNAIGRYRISAHRGDREDPGPAEGTDDLGRLAAWVSLSLNPQVEPFRHMLRGQKGMIFRWDTRRGLGVHKRQIP